MSNSLKLSLAVIVKDEAEKLDNLLKSVDGVFDEICLTMTKPDATNVRKVAINYDCRISHFEWVNDFSKARTFNFSQCKGDWIMWLDADDIVEGAEEIRKSVELADKNGLTALATKYHYSHDERGNVKDMHWKTQIVKRDHYEWKGIIHEDLLPLKDGKQAKLHEVIRVHTANDVDSAKSLRRNLKILKEAVKLEPDEPRHYFYMARCYLGTEEWQNVVDVIDTYLNLSDWPTERYDAMNMKGEALRRMEMHDEAIKVHNDAILELEDCPDAYIWKAQNYIMKERWADAITCLEIAEQRDKETAILKRYALYDHDLYNMYAIAAMNLGLYDAALKAANTAVSNRPSDYAKEIQELARQMYADEQLTLEYFKKGKELLTKPVELHKLLTEIPDRIKDDPRILRLAFNEVKHWPENSITYYCGNSLEAWDGNSVNNGGIGGSETAVVELSKRWVAEGKQVTVFNKCDAPADGKMVDGVLYKNFWQFNPDDHYDTVVLWRWPQFAQHVNNAKRVLLDMHDVSNPGYFTEEVLAKVDKVMVKTEYHKSLYPTVTEDKFVVVGNGIDTTRFTEVEKNPYKFIYTSSANRGLEHVLDMWPDIRKKWKEAELHIFYGWKSYYESHKTEPTKMAWMEHMQELMEQEGVINHDRVGQKELAEQMSDSTLWLYPTEFPEIHCITALEMQAAGVYPITTGFAALAETQVSGIKIDGEPSGNEFRERFINEMEMAIKNPDLIQTEVEKGKQYAQDCSWDNVANVWLKQM